MRSLIRRLFGGSEGDGDVPAVEHREFEAGQVWRFHSRPDEEQSALTITRVETHPSLGTVVHVRVQGVRIPNPMHPDGESSEIGHMPFAADAVRRSVTHLVHEGSETGDDDGYATWKEAFDRDDAGVFTITVAEVVEMMEQAVRQ